MPLTDLIDPRTNQRITPIQAIHLASQPRRGLRTAIEDANARYVAAQQEASDLGTILSQLLEMVDHLERRRQENK
jgi:hypothetical protein